MKRPLTDHEYQINGGSWIGCTDSNTTDNGGGIYTITDGLDVYIPIGSLKVRVKALSINPASAALQNTVAYKAPIVGDTPMFYVNPIKTMAVGDADQLLGFVSSSVGAVTYVSSDTSKATIVVTGGNAYLHAVAAGDVTVTANQAANAGYAPATDNCLGTVVAATTVDDLTYSTVTLGKAATVDGSSFNVTNANTFTLKKYLMVSGNAVYQGTYPTALLKTAKAVKDIIYSGSLGTMPVPSLFDIDSSFAAFDRNKIRSIGSTDALDTNILKFNKFVGSYSSEGSISIIEINADVFQIDFPTNNSGSGAVSVVGPLIHAIIPSGTWTMALDVKLPSAAATRSISWGDFGGTYQTITLTTNYQSIVWEPIIHDVDEQLGYKNIIQGVDSVSAAFSIIVTNIRLVPGTADTGASAYNQLNPALSNGVADLGQGVKADLSLNFAQMTGGNGLIYKPSTSTALSAMTMMFAMKATPHGTNANVVISDRTSANYMYYPVNRYMYTSGGPNMFGAIQQSAFYFDDGRWNIIAYTMDGSEQNLYVNGYQIAHVEQSISAITLDKIYALGQGGDGFSCDSDVSSYALWDSKLSISEVLAATNLIVKRMRLKNHFLSTDKNYLICEGDSITALPNAYSRLLRDAYANQLYGATPAQSGARLADLYSRQAWVNARITEAVTRGKNVIFTVLVGANDIHGLTDSTATTSFYNSMMTYVAAARTVGAKVVVCTVLDQASLSDKTWLIALNNLIRSDATKYDALFDFYANAAFQTATNTNYSDDLLHPNDTGFALMREIAKPILDTLLVF